MIIINFYIVTHFLIAVISLFVSAIVLSKNRRSVTHITLSLFSFSIFLWSAAYGRWLLSSNETEALFWSRVLNLGATLIPVFLFHWIMSFLNLSQKRKKAIIFYYIITSFFALFSFSNSYIWGVAKIQQFPYWPQINWLYIIFLAICWIPIFFYSFFLLIRELRIRSSSARQQVLYVLLGLVIGFLGGSTNYFLMFGFKIIPPIGSILVIVFPVFFSYAVIRHRLMDIKLVLRQSSVYLGSVLVVLVPATGILYYFDRFFPKYVIFSAIAILILGVLAFAPIRNFFYRFANKYFFSSLYDSRELIANLSDELRSTLNINQIYNFISKTLINAFHIKAFGILDYDDKNKDYIVRYNSGFNVGEQKRFPGNETLRQAFIKQAKSVVTEEIKESVYPGTEETVKLLNNFGAAVLTPLNIRNETLGLMVLGQKESGDMFNDEDLRTLETIASQAAIAIKNAQLYEETKNFSLTLQQEVDRQTAELQKAYEDLKVLDKAKSEFISMASHQLRTPLSAIKGYISMLVDGSYGKLPEKARGKLKNVFESNERLIRVVNDLLDISKIEMGKMELEKESTQIEDLLQSCYEEMKIGADKKGLRFIFEKPKYSLPKIELDPLKFRQAILNLIDNAIRYTQKGEIEIEVKKTNSTILISVKDTGEGLTAEEQRAVFEGFTRGSAGIAHFVEGAGLGLYVAKKFLELHHAKIWVESGGKGKGSTFFVELPIK